MRFIKADYNSVDGISGVIIEHLGQNFSGFAWVHPDDKENASEFAGCEYAEMRATIQALKYELKLEKKAYKECLNFVKACKCYKKFNEDDDTAKVMYRQLNRRKVKVEILQKRIEMIQEELDILISRRDKIMIKLKEKKEEDKKG